MDKNLINLLSVNENGDVPSKRLIIIGVNPIIQLVTRNPQIFYDMLKVNEELTITFFYESETENFSQSLFYEKGISKSKMDFDKLQTYRNRLIGDKNGKKKVAGLFEDVLSLCSSENEKENIRERIRFFQNNLRQFANLIISDDKIKYCFTTLDLPCVDMYKTIDYNDDPKLYFQLNQYVEYLQNPNTGGKYMSIPGDELIELYDMHNIPRGIYPRKAFYATNYQRYSIWAFIFNRKGEILLQKRSPFTADNRNLWDKSAGGHVDLMDSSTIETAKRELVEELFLPEAEFSKYMKADLGDIVDFGEWNIDKRTEKAFEKEFKGLSPIDWIVFRADGQDGKPMTIKRKSPRTIHVKETDENGQYIPLLDDNGNYLLNERKKKMFKERVETWYTRFISDVYLFIAPDGYIDSEQEIDELMKISEEKGAQSAHRLMTIDELIEDVENNPQNYTDDMIYMCSEEKWLLIEFAESIKYIFPQKN